MCCIEFAVFFCSYPIVFPSGLANDKKQRNVSRETFTQLTTERQIMIHLLIAMAYTLLA